MSIKSIHFFLLIQQVSWAHQPPIDFNLCTFDNGILQCAFDTTNTNSGECFISSFTFYA